jgi:LmbE family N-acetylglucosaminyl deacetylase
MISLRPDNLRTVLCLGAHADDIEIGCGGALLHWLADAHAVDVHWVVFGAEGRREAEARQSAERFLRGARNKTIVVKNWRDSYFPYAGEEIKEYFAQLREEVSPDVVFTHRREDAHQDHRLLAELTWCAFRNHLILEYEIPKYEGDLGSPNAYVPLAESICRRKVELLMEGFPSQREKPWFTEDLFWGLMRLRGAECNAPSRFAEALYCRKLTLG